MLMSGCLFKRTQLHFAISKDYFKKQQSVCFMYHYLGINPFSSEQLQRTDDKATETR
jgi:hypothetical protein